MSNFGVRNYDDGLGRFMSVDDWWEKYRSWSPYHYSFNNPLTLKDPSGFGAGDLFDSMNKAALDWGKTYNDNSIRTNREYGSTIYSVATEAGVQYSYSEPNIGDNRSVLPSEISEAPDGIKPVAWVHSHAAYDPMYDNNDFSLEDKIYTQDHHGIPAYVSTPDGSLKKYDIETNTTTTVSTKLPSDPKDPERKNKIDPVETIFEYDKGAGIPGLTTPRINREMP